MDKVAVIVGVAPMRVYEVATFYTMFNREKRGKYFIQLCGTTPCMICGSQDIKNTIMEYADIKDGQTSADGLFTLLEVECLGACANAPMVQMNDDYYECLTPESTIALLDGFSSGATHRLSGGGHAFASRAAPAPRPFLRPARKSFLLLEARSRPCPRSQRPPPGGSLGAIAEATTTKETRGHPISFYSG